MRIEKLELKNFRGFEELTINFPENNVAVFIGKNGSGKSSILDAIIRLIKPRYEKSINFIGSIDVKFGFDYTRVTGKFSNREEPIMDFWSNVTRNSLDPDNTETQVFIKRDFDKYLAFHYKDTRNFISEKSTDYKDFFLWFVNKENIENQEKIYLQDLEFELDDLKVVRSAIELFLAEMDYSGLKKLRVHREVKEKDLQSDDNKVSELKEPESNWKIDVHSYLLIDKDEETFYLDQLSSGEKTVLLMVADIARRLIGVKGNKSENILETAGMILIDEIQMNLHPNWQRKILPALTKTFPNIQFIVTTHSPQVVSSLDKESVFILNDFKLLEHKPYTKGRDANSILSEVFGVPRWTEDVRAKINKLYRLIDDDKKEEALAALKELEKDFGPSDLELVRANMFLEFMEEEVN